MTQARLRIVGPTIHEIKRYYFSIEETAHNLNVPESWIMERLDKLKEPITQGGTWYLSPSDYAHLRKIRNETFYPVVG